MKKNLMVFLVMVSVVTVFVSGCSNSPAAPEDNNASINVIIQKNEGSGISLCQFAAYVTDSTGSTISTAAISMSGPTGALPGSMISGVFVYQDMTGASFAHDSMYAVSVTMNAKNYYATVYTNGGITMPADGSTVSWGYDADAEIIMVITPAMTFLSYGPALSSPFDLVAAGAYAAGTGSYQVSATMTDAKSMSMIAGTDVSTAATIQHMKTVIVSK